MTFVQLISILRARWRLMAATFFGLIVLILVVSLILPKKYTGIASVVVDPKPDPVSAMLYPNAASPAFMATQVDIIESDRVAQRVVRNLKLADNPQVREQWKDATDGQGSIEQWLVNNLEKSLDVKPSRESNVLTVSYRAPDPAFAAGLANAFVQAYVDVSLDLRVDPAKLYSSFFDTRAKESRAALEKAQRRLSDFQAAKGIIATDERLDVENSRLNELTTQLVAIEALTAESSSRQVQARGAGASQLQEVLTNPVIGSLKADLSHQEAHLQELSSRLGDNNPQVLESKANINELRTRLAEETRRVTGGVGVSSTINLQRESQLRADLEAQRTKVLHMKQVRDEGAVIERDVENAQHAYEAVTARLNQSSLESQTTQSNVNQLTTATPPVDPSSPRLLLNTLVGVFLGVILAVAAALVAEMRDRRLRAVEDVAPLLGVPVIGVMPKPNARRLRRGKVVPTLMQQRMVGQLAAPGKGT